MRVKKRGVMIYTIRIMSPSFDFDQIIVESYVKSGPKNLATKVRCQSRIMVEIPGGAVDGGLRSR